MTTLSYTKEELLEVASRMRLGKRETLEDVLDQIEKEAVHILLTPVRPPSIPQYYVRRAVDVNGFNIGTYTIEGGDQHYWFPVEEARKERPNRSLGILVEKGR